MDKNDFSDPGDNLDIEYLGGASLAITLLSNLESVIDFGKSFGLFER